jgi:hypothetical protein
MDDTIQFPLSCSCMTRSSGIIYVGLKKTHFYNSFTKWLASVRLPHAKVLSRVYLNFLKKFLEVPHQNTEEKNCVPIYVRSLRLRLHWSQKRHNTTVWTDSRQGSGNRVATLNPTCVSRRLAAQGLLVLCPLIVSDVNGT